LVRSALLSAGHLYSQLLLFSNVLLPPPSHMYAMRVHGAPQKPMRGTRPARPWRVRVTASKT
jgi:hypothetical protein